MRTLEEPLRSVFAQLNPMLNSTRKAILMLLLAVVSSNAMAEWVKVGSSEIDTLYVDLSTIRRHGADNTAKMWAMNDFKAAQRRDEGEPSFRSEKAEYEYDCKLVQSRMLYFTSHTENMAGGEVVNYNFVPGDWAPVSPNTELEELWKIACGRL